MYPSCVGQLFCIMNFDTLFSFTEVIDKVLLSFLSFIIRRKESSDLFLLICLDICVRFDSYTCILCC